MIQIKKIKYPELNLFQGDVFIGTISNSAELLEVRIQIAEQKIPDCLITYNYDGKSYRLLIDEFGVVKGHYPHIYEDMPKLKLLLKTQMESRKK